MNTKALRLAAVLLAQMGALGSLRAQTAVSWDAGGGADTNTSTGLNWATNSVPTFGSGVQATFTTGGTANVDNNMVFGPTAAGPTPAIQFGGNFTFNAGGGSVTVYGSNTGTTPVFRTNSGASAVTVSAPVRVFATAPSAVPLGNLLVLLVNNTTASNTALNLTGGLGLAGGSTASTYDLRFGNGSGGTTGAAARIAGTITGLGAIANANNVWNGKLIIAGSQSLGSSNITISSGAGFGNPAAAAQVVLGESASDVQTWNNVTLNNTMTVAVGGTVSVNAVGGTTTAGRIVGTGASGATLKITSGTLNSANIAVGGSTVAEKTLDIVKQNAGTLAVSGAHTYTGSTTVDGGTLTLSSGTTLATSGIAVNSGGTLSNAATGLTAPITVNAGGTLSGEGGSGALKFGNGSSTFNFDPATPGAFTAASYTANSSALVLLTPSSATTIGNSYLVLSSTAGFGSSVPSEFAASARGTLSLASGNTQVLFSPTAAASLVWTGANGTNPSFWDPVNTINWTNGGSPDRFYSGDAVTFNDTAVSTTVAVQGTSLAPGAITINNPTKAYTFSGGAIVSSGALSKGGAQSATIGNAVTVTGVTVDAGSLALNAASTIGASGVTVNGGSLTLGAANTFTSDIALNGGVLHASTGSLGSFAGVRNIALAGGELDYSGSSTISSDNINLNVTGNSAIGVSSSGVTLRAGGTFAGSGALAIQGSGVVALGRNTADAAWGSGYTGAITVGTGAVLSLRNEQSLGSTSSGTTVSTGGTVMLDPFSQSAVTFAAETIAFQGNSTLSNRLNGQSSLTNTLSGAISTAGTLGVNTLGGAATLVFNGVISGAGGVTFGSTSTVSGLSTANGVYVLNAANTFTGATTLLGGTVRLGGNERLADSSLLVLGGGTLDLAGFSETVGALDLDASTALALGSSSSIWFAASAGQDWGSSTLNFTTLSGFVANSVRFGTNASGLTGAQLSLISVDGLGGYGLDSSGFLIAIPEPAAWGALGGLGALGVALRRRRQGA